MSFLKAVVMKHASIWFAVHTLIPANATAVLKLQWHFAMEMTQDTVT